MIDKKLNLCGDEVIRLAYPAFQSGNTGSIPSSPLYFKFGKIDIKKAILLNKIWHSKLPILTNWQDCEAYAAIYENVYFAVAIWGRPIARMLNDSGWWELRRMAISDDAPKNTASRMLKVMKILIKKDRPNIVKLISYQDTEAHAGTIYKAAGWYQGKVSGTIGIGWNSRKRNKMQTTAVKIRWECDLKDIVIEKKKRSKIKNNQIKLFEN